MFDWSGAMDGFKALGAIGGVGVALLQFRATSLRGKIKADLDILQSARTLFGAEDTRCKRIEAKSTKMMSYLYKDLEGVPRRRVPWSDLFLFLFCVVGAVGFGWTPMNTGIGGFGNVVQLLVAVVFSFVALGAILNALEKLIGSDVYGRV